MKTKFKNIKQNSLSNRHQSGYVLLVSVMLLGAMLIATLGYFEQSSAKLQLSGYNRDSAEALLLAESASNSLYGQYNFNDDIDLDNLFDRNEAVDINALDKLPLFYMYVVKNKTTVINTEPSILQLIANGEARSDSHKAVTIANNQIPNKAKNLIIDELFTSDNTAKPVLYTLDENMKLTMNKTDTWAEAIANNEKAAISWLELTLNSDGNISVYVQTVAKVGQSKNYVQRFVGIFPGKLGPIGAANESSP